MDHGSCGTLCHISTARHSTPPPAAAAGQLGAAGAGQVWPGRPGGDGLSSSCRYKQLRESGFRSAGPHNGRRLFLSAELQNQYGTAPVAALQVIMYILMLCWCWLLLWRSGLFVQRTRTLWRVLAVAPSKGHGLCQRHLWWANHVFFVCEPCGPACHPQLVVGPLPGLSTLCYHKG